MVVEGENTVSEVILNNILSVINKYDNHDLEHSFKTYDNKGRVSLCLEINFITYDNGNTINSELYSELKSLKELDNIESVTTIYYMGSLKYKVNDKVKNAYGIKAKLSGVDIDQSIIDRVKAEYIQKCYNSLNKKGVINFIKKYDIKTFDEFISVITKATKDVNKSIKVDSLSSETKKKYYTIKSWVIKILLKVGYIDKINTHKINGIDYVLVTTKVENENSYNGIISFHIPYTKWFKYSYLVPNGDLDSYEVIDNEYKIIGFVEDRELMDDFIDMISSNLVGTEYIEYLKTYFNNFY